MAEDGGDISLLGELRSGSELRQGFRLTGSKGGAEMGDGAFTALGLRGADKRAEFHHSLVELGSLTGGNQVCRQIPELLLNGGGFRVATQSEDAAEDTNHIRIHNGDIQA